MFEKLRVIIDVISDKATAGINGFRSSLAQADGFSGKLKAGVSSLGSMFGSFVKSPQGAAVAVGAAGAAMFKAVGDALDLGLAVGKLKDATGLSADEASRWIEVAGDMGIEADTVAGLMTKLEMNIGKNPEKFKELGLQIRYASDGTVDANGTMLAAIDLLNKQTDPAKRAALGAQLFGKSWKDASELIVKGGDAVKKKLDEVSGSKIVDQKEIDQAREFRDTLDDLKDVGENLVITVGQAVIPILNDMIPVLTEVAKAVGFVSDAVGFMFDDFGDGLARDGVKDWMHELTTVHGPALQARLKLLSGGVVEFGDDAKETAQKAGELAVKEEELAVKEEELAVKTRDAARAFDEANFAYKQFMDSLSDEEAVVAIKSAMDDIQQELDDTGVISDESRLRIERMFASTIAEGRALASQNFKVLVDTGQLEVAQAMIDRINQAAAAGATFSVSTEMYVGSELRRLLEGRSLVDSIDRHTRNGGVGPQ